MKIVKNNLNSGFLNDFKDKSVEELDKLEGIDRTLRFQCNHRSEDGTRDDISQDPNTGILTCNICKRRFFWFKVDEDDVNEIDELASSIIDIIESIRAMGSVDDEFIRKNYKLFEAVESLDRLGSIYLEAMDIFKKEKGEDNCG